MRPALARRERLLARLPGVILAISESVRRDLIDEVGLGETRVRVLSGGVPNIAPVDREQARRRFALAPDEFAVVSAGSLTVHKCPEVLIRSFEGLAGARLLLAGDGPEEKRLKALAHELGLADSVRFLGHVTDVAELTAAADAIAVASWPREGLSLSAIEGLRAGRPVIVTDVGGLPEVVEHDVSGYVVAPNEPQRFTEAFAKLRDDAALREAMGRRARQRFLENFELQHYLEELEALYRP
jgi:glycosyltransferase involved in cell wall biosynthesis